MNKEQWVSIF